MAFQFHISIKDIKPMIWRRLVVPSNSNFFELHLAIQGAFGWENCHLFQFGKTGLMDKEGIGMPDPADEAKIYEAKDVELSTVFKKKKDAQVYIYDFGDHWLHEVVLESIVDTEPAGFICTAGENECPPEDVGGIYGYSSMTTCFASGTEKEKKEYRQWLGLKPKENWDPAYFSLRETNKRLVLIFQE
jgi:hypothetical protein